MGNSGCGARRDAEAVKDNQRLRLNAFESVQFSVWLANSPFEQVVTRN
jgi:hypothetical protein